MTVSTRTSAPSYKIFEPDALDAVYAKGVISDPIMGGIAGAMGLAHDMSKMRNQDNYLASQEKFNRWASALDAMEIDSKTKQKAMELGIGLIKEGEDPTKVLGANMVYANPADSSLPALKRGELQATINQKNAAASADRGKDSMTVQESYTPPGGNKSITITHKGKPGSVPIPAGYVIDPKTSTPVQPNANAGANIQQQVEVRARAAAGPDAKKVAEKNGATAWQGSKGYAVFDPSGTLDRDQSKLR